MLEQSFRDIYQKILVAPVLPLLPQSVTPQYITALSAVLGFAFIPAILLNQPLWAIIFLVLSGYCDTLDGSLARARNQSSAKGAVLDIMADRFVECSVLLGLFLCDPENNGLWIFLMLCTSLLCITSFLVVGVFEKNNSVKSFHYSPGLIERAEAFIFFALMVVFPAYLVSLAIIYTILVLYTAAKRIIEFYTFNN